MKTLIQHIAESKALHQNVNIAENKALHQNVNIQEKLIINKNYKVDNSITSLINVLFDNIDEEDTTWKPDKDDIFLHRVIQTMIYDNLSQFLARQQRNIYVDTCDAFKVLPEHIYRTKYIRAIIKQHITENYADECNELLKITDKCFINNKCFINKEVKLINSYVMRLSMNEQYAMLFLYNKSNNIVMALFIIEI